MTFKTFVFAAILSIGIVSCGAPNTEPAKPSISDNPYFLAADKTVNIDGINIRYRDEGSKDLPAIVMIHGFTSSLETWDALAGELLSDYRIVRLDLPGHGLSDQDPTGNYSNARTVELFTKFSDKLSLENPALVGNSLGGLIAWRTAQSNPSSAAKLILISPGGFSINSVTEDPVAVPMMVKIYLTKAPSAGVKQATSALYGDPALLTEDRLTQIEDMMKRSGNGDAFVTRAGQFTLPNPESDLASVSTPTLIIWGEKDIMIPPSQGPRFLEAMPYARLINYEGIGHVPQEEAPARLAKDIRDFLSEKETP